jgi:hypothetical protein
MSEHKLITPRRNFLVGALGFTAAGAAVSIPVLLADDPHKRAALHMAELVKALQEIYPHVRLSGGTINYAGWGDGAFVYPHQISAEAVCSRGPATASQSLKVFLEAWSGTGQTDGSTHY